MAKQGCAFSESEIRKMITLLSSTDMTISEVAERLGCSRSAVSTVNRKFQVRNNASHPNRWEVEIERVS